MLFPKPSRLTAAERQAERRGPQGYRKPAPLKLSGSSYPGFALAKGPTRQAVKTERREEQNAVVKEVRADVWRRSDFCEACGDSERDTAKIWPKAEHEMHEIRPRSLTRGLPPRERFSTVNCCRLCGPCHHAIGVKIRILPLTADGMDDAYDVQRKNADGEWETVLTVDRKRGLRA